MTLLGLQEWENKILMKFQTLKSNPVQRWHQNPVKTLSLKISSTQPCKEIIQSNESKQTPKTLLINKITQEALRNRNWKQRTNMRQKMVQMIYLMRMKKMILSTQTYLQSLSHVNS